MYEWGPGVLWKFQSFKNYLTLWVWPKEGFQFPMLPEVNGIKFTWFDLRLGY
jgi:hypothetical protein